MLYYEVSPVSSVFTTMVLIGRWLVRVSEPDRSADQLLHRSIAFRRDWLNGLAKPIAKLSSGYELMVGEPVKVHRESDEANTGNAQANREVHLALP